MWTWLSTEDFHLRRRNGESVRYPGMALDAIPLVIRHGRDVLRARHTEVGQASRPDNAHAGQEAVAAVQVRQIGARAITRLRQCRDLRRIQTYLSREQAASSVPCVGQVATTVLVRGLPLERPAALAPT